MAESNGPDKKTVALFVDGENISAAQAGKIILNARKHGDLLIKRVYGQFGVNVGWEKTVGFRLIHTGTGKNSADMMLAIQAVDFAHRNKLDTFVLASSDGDFSHLAHHLRENGYTVVGIGERKAPDGFRKACNEFIEICASEKASTVVPVEPCNIAPVERTINQQIIQLLKENANGSGMKISRLGGQMHSKYKIKISSLPEKTWRAYLTKRPTMFECDARGADACVRLK